jgi:hypothetical protein
MGLGNFVGPEARVSLSDALYRRSPLSRVLVVRCMPDNGAQSCSWPANRSSFFENRTASGWLRSLKYPAVNARVFIPGNLFPRSASVLRAVPYLGARMIFVDLSQTRGPVPAQIRLRALVTARKASDAAFHLDDDNVDLDKLTLTLRRLQILARDPDVLETA